MSAPSFLPHAQPDTSGREPAYVETQGRQSRVAAVSAVLFGMVLMLLAMAAAWFFWSFAMSFNEETAALRPATKIEMSGSIEKRAYLVGARARSAEDFAATLSTLSSPMSHDMAVFYSPAEHLKEMTMPASSVPLDVVFVQGGKVVATLIGVPPNRAFPVRFVDNRGQFVVEDVIAIAAGQAQAAGVARDRDVAFLDDSGKLAAR